MKMSLIYASLHIIANITKNLGDSFWVKIHFVKILANNFNTKY